ncbi:polysaccharide biosynthesis/export family protein [Granulicella sp. dw_53]|uniref:polysaccharide biosynthesis/export family protein n=1 Tax=Granulicella sp. dw_53 TaxID=2719792 RepID=UPI001BD5A582|nr:polysaccharide biosynthesis/export family protein [Granulicella sp. dw_53]
MRSHIITRCLLLQVSALCFVGHTSLALQSDGSNTAGKAVRDVDLKASLNRGQNVLGPGDQLSIHVADLDEISDKPIRVDPNGEIDLSLIGRIHVAGLTLSQFKTDLAERLKKYIDNPQITINVTDNQSRPVSVIGEVNAPGVHQLPGPLNLIEVISLAGGVKNDAGSKVIVTRQMRWGPLPLPNTAQDATGAFTTATLSLDNLLSSKTPADNISIQPNDVISIPRGDIVYVIGNVRRAGGFPLASHEKMSLLQALSLAEGLSPNAAMKDSKILRPIPGSDNKPQEIPVDVKQIFAGKAPDVPLFANDILFIPNSAAKSGSRRAAEAVLQMATGVAIYAR